MKKEFLIQRIAEDGEEFNTLMSDAELIHYIDMNDIYNERYDIWLIGEFGKVEHCHYTGWQPMCKIEIVKDTNGEPVCVGEGEDH